MKTPLALVDPEKIRTSVDDFFSRHGRRVARHPKITVLLSLGITAISLAGLATFDKKTIYIDLWVPRTADSKVHGEWLNTHSPPELRSQSLIVTAENVLTPRVVRTLYDIHKRVESTTARDGSSWQHHCKKMPVVRDVGDLTEPDDDYYDFFGTSLGDDYDEELDSRAAMEPAVYSSLHSYPQPYCSVLDTVPEKCLELGILELFATNGEYSDERIERITQEEILDMVNFSNKSQVFLTERNFTRFLGGIRYNEKGQIVGASATRVQFITSMNTTEALLRPIPWLGFITSEETFEFEAALLSTLLDKSSYPEGVDSSPRVSHSRETEEARVLTGGYPLLAIGFCLMVVYLLLMLGKFSLVEHRAWITVPALVTVGMGITFSVGLCSPLFYFFPFVFPLPFTDMHVLLPLILLAIGIDDAFVVVGALDHVNKTSGEKDSIEQRFGKVMKQAGVSISITSITDIVAFFTGGMSAVPGSSSFCIYCSFGLVGIYLSTVTFFLATLVLKEQHVEDSRDGCLPCIRRSRTSKKTAGGSPTTVFRRYTDLLMKAPVKMTVMCITATILSVGVWGCTLVENNEKAQHMLSKGNYLREWHDVREENFQDDMDLSAIYVQDVSHQNFGQIHELLEKMNNEKDIISEVSFWTQEFLDYINLEQSSADTIPASGLTKEMFQEKLAQFLYSPRGSQFRFMFTFEANSSLTCGGSAPNIRLGYFPFTHTLMTDFSVYIPAMNKIKDMVKTSNISGLSFPYSEAYFRWEMTETMEQELPRNMSIGLLAIFLLTLVFLMDFKISLFVNACVIFSLINTIGFGHFWGLTINIYTTCTLIISTGLYVDYSIHVAHAFLKQAEGSTEQRIVLAMEEVGPAVFHGGFSTFLAICVTSASANYTWRIFFKVFMMITLFGLFHGLAFLPVMLSFLSSNKEETGRSEKEDSNGNIPEIAPNINKHQEDVAREAGGVHRVRGTV